MDQSIKTGAAGKTILIVDDELGILEVLEFILSDAGFSVKTAFNGQDALARLAENTPDLVILDYMMPILDGRGVVEAMRANPRYAEIPIILTSALPESNIPIRSDAYQAFLRKPYKTEPLMEQVRHLLDRRDQT
jgi:CheY-like chemotaxis protein